MRLEARIPADPCGRSKRLGAFSSKASKPLSNTICPSDGGSGEAASVDWSLNVLAAAHPDATLSEQLLSFARKFVIDR